MFGPALAFGIVGLCVGSFLTTLAARSDRGFAGLLTGRSSCPKCHQPIGVGQLIPILSWFMLRGRCRSCREPIAVSYPLTELGAAGIGAVAAWCLPLPAAFVTALLGWWLFGAALIDLRSYWLPDATTLPLIPAGFVSASLADRLALVMPPPIEAALAALVGFGTLAALRWLYFRLRGREGLGLGDAKLCGAAGAWLGLATLPWLLLMAAMAGLAGAVLVHRSLRADLAVPFGPALALSFWLLFFAAQLG